MLPWMRLAIRTDEIKRDLVVIRDNLHEKESTVIDLLLKKISRKDIITTTILFLMKGE
jgi:hypothetical protein